jgi:hypothetical protein
MEPVGAGVGGYDALVTIVRSTIAGNLAMGPEDGVVVAVGGGLYVWGGSSFRVSNTVVWGNCATGDGDQVYLEGTLDSLKFRCSAIDSSGVAGPGAVIYMGEQVFTDPLLCDAKDCWSAPTTDGDFRLRWDSPCLPENSPCGETIGATKETCAPSWVWELPFSGDLLRGVLTRVYPNPSRGRVWYELRLVEPARVEVRVLDVRGRVVARLLDGELGRGEHRLVWDVEARKVAGLGSGVYYLQVETGPRRESRRVVILR